VIDHEIPMLSREDADEFTLYVAAERHVRVPSVRDGENNPDIALKPEISPGVLNEY
jgi:hypothetical protein